MKIYKLEYSLDQFMDGRMEEGVHLFSTLDKLFQFAELYYGKKKEDFGEYNGTYSCVADVNEWDTESWYISEVFVDEDLEKVLEEKER